MVDNSQSEGEFFTRLYIERAPPMRDSITFRNRLIGYLQANHRDEYGEIGSHAKQELGLIMPIQYHVLGGFSDVPAFLGLAPIKDFLNLITVIWRVLKPRYGETKWREFVARAMREESLGYSIDAYGGVHYLVDEEFERNRVSVLRGLESQRYAAVRAAFESAHSYLDAQPPDAKACVRSMFEALEILARLMEPGSQRLNKQLVVDKLKVSATWLLPDAIEVKALEKIFDGIADWVDGMHIYRHGQATEDPVAPSMELAVYVLSSGAAMLRLLLGIDAGVGGHGAPALRPVGTTE
jgi:hypothetical protein